MAKKFQISPSDFDTISLKKDTINEGNKPFRLTFVNKNCYRPKGTNTVVCEIGVQMNWVLPDYLTNALMWDWKNKTFAVKAVAVCHDEDEFDMEKGIAIASTKAEMQAYKEAFRRLSLFNTQLNRLSLACTNGMKDMYKFNGHNEKFLDDVIEGKQKVGKSKNV